MSFKGGSPHDFPISRFQEFAISGFRDFAKFQICKDFVVSGIRAFFLLVTLRFPDFKISGIHDLAIPRNANFQGFEISRFGATGLNPPILESLKFGISRQPESRNREAAK